MEKFRIIGLMGKATSGKDTAGEMLRGLGNGKTVAFADKLKDIVSEMFDLSHDTLYTEEGKARFIGEHEITRKGKTTKAGTLLCFTCPECHSIEVETFKQEATELARCKLCSTIGDRSVFQSYWSGRTILQFLGTNGFRRIDPYVWARYGLRTAKAYLQLQIAPTPTFVVFTDCRFRSELEAILNVGGEVWRIRRPETDQIATGLKGHASETEQDGIKDSELAAVILNDGTLDALRAKLATELDRFMKKTADY